MMKTTEDLLYKVADAISLELEKRPDQYFTPSRIAGWASVRKASGDKTFTVETTLEWMVAERYVLTNGRGGCWVRYRHRPLFHSTRLT